MMDYTSEELEDMHLMYGEAHFVFRGNGHEMRRLYHERFRGIIFQAIPSPMLIEDYVKPAHSLYQI